MAYSWPKPTGTIKISNTVVIRSSIKDYKMQLVDGGGLSGTGNQAENQEAPFDLTGSGSKLRNAIAKSWPEAIHIHGDKAIVENIFISDVGEDAITIFTGADHVIILNCVFAKAADKMIQINGGSNILIKNCKFLDGFSSAIRVKKGTGKLTIEGCHFENGSGAVVLDSGVPTPTISRCTYKGVKYKLRKG